MIIKIGNNTITNAIWRTDCNIGILKYNTDTNLIAAIERFSNFKNIDIYDDEENLIGIWYDTEIRSINKLENGYIEIYFDGGYIAKEKEQELTDNISNNENAIIELANLVIEIEENIEENHILNNRIMENTNKQNEKIEELNHIIGEMRDNIVALESNIAKMPINIGERVSELEDNFNNLSDRIAYIENKIREE